MFYVIRFVHRLFSLFGIKKMLGKLTLYFEVMYIQSHTFPYLMLLPSPPHFKYINIFISSKFCFHFGTNFNFLRSPVLYTALTQSTSHWTLLFANPGVIYLLYITPAIVPVVAVSSFQGSRSASKQRYKGWWLIFWLLKRVEKLGSK